MYPRNKSISSNIGTNFRNPSNSNKFSYIKDNDKTSHIVAHNIVYNTPKITSNHNSNANVLPRDENSREFIRTRDRDDTKLSIENKELKEEILGLRKVRRKFMSNRKILIKINS